MALSLEHQEWAAILATLDVTDAERNALHTYAETLIERGFPVIFGFDHLSSLLGIERKVLRQLVNAPRKFYRTFEIPKRSGGLRTISAPYPLLLETQRWINRSILSKLQTHDAAHGFVKERSIIGNAARHLNCHSLLRIDLKDFFPSIGIRRILGVFRWMGYTPTVGYYLAALCSLEDCLPQGAATSPTLSNVIANSLDRRISALASGCGLNYSRYADDLIFSGNRIALSTVDFIRGIIKDEGFEINEEKTFLASGNKKKIVTGISVVGERLKLPRNTRRLLRQELHHIQRAGIRSHIEATGQQNPLYIDSLLGKFTFWRQVEPDNEYVADGIEYLRHVQLAVDRGDF